MTSADNVRSNTGCCWLLDADAGSGLTVTALSSLLPDAVADDAGTDVDAVIVAVVDDAGLKVEPVLVPSVRSARRGHCLS